MLDATLAIGFAAGVVVAMITAPVGVSGAVFLLPIQLSVLAVPSPAVTPTNLLFNVIAVPGALARYRRSASLRSPLTALLLAGSVPGVVVGAVIRIFAVPDERTFKIIVAALLLPLGGWLLLRTIRPRAVSGASGTSATSRRPAAIVTLSAIVGVAGGIYGIGGGSLISPILVGRGMSTAVVAPAALPSTLITSLVGAGAYGVIAVLSDTPAATPYWALGVACGVGGLLGGYLGAHYRQAVSEKALKVILGVLAVVAALIYATQAVTT